MIPTNAVVNPQFYGYLDNRIPMENIYHNDESLQVKRSTVSQINPNGLLAKLGLPCQDTIDYDYGQCFGYYENGRYNVCQFVEVGDIEDFMNNEKRKEKSRNAARCRRSKETELYYDLAKSLPFSKEQVSQLDKASVMRLAISYLKIRNIAAVSDWNLTKENSPEDGSLFLKTLDGFIMILSEEGDFVYLSENVHEYLGINQIDLMGQNIFEYTHPCDHDEIREVLSGKESEDSYKSLLIRMKCTLTTRGRSVTLKSAVYKVIQSSGHVIKYKNYVKKENSDEYDTKNCYVAVNQSIPHPSNIESPLPKQTFLTKHNMDMKFTHADDELMKDILGYNSTDLLGKSVYEYYHAMDSDRILGSYKCLFAKGQCQTEQYRFLAKYGGYVWLVTQATLILDKNQKPQSVVCVNYVISGLECQDEIYSSSQFATVKLENKPVNSPVETAISIPEIVITTDKEDTDDEEERQVNEIKRPVSSTRRLFGNPREIEGEARPTIATSKIFMPRTKDMNKGFLTFSDEAPGLTMLKDEPEDLTHLAPTAGDVCVPLEDHSFLPEMLDDILLRDSFGPLLTQEPSDPFISYRDYQDPSPQLLSPNLSKHSDCSLPSLSSPSDSFIDDDPTSTFMNMQMDDDVEPPYISMNMSDDLPWLVSNDLMWSTNDRKSQQPDSLSLAQLLSNSVSKHNCKSSDHGGGIIDKHDKDEICNTKIIRKSWTENKLYPKTIELNREERNQSTKRSNCSVYEHVSKKTRSDSKDKMTSELLHQLISNNQNRGRQKEKGNWLIQNSPQKAACISQPSDSVLMNLLVDTNTNPAIRTILSPAYKDLLPNDDVRRQQLKERDRRNQLLKNSFNLLDPDASSIASLMDLTQQDFEVNAPVGKDLLHGAELLTALDINTGI